MGDGWAPEVASMVRREGRPTAQIAADMLEQVEHYHEMRTRYRELRSKRGTRDFRAVRLSKARHLDWLKEVVGDGVELSQLTIGDHRPRCSYPDFGWRSGRLVGMTLAFRSARPRRGGRRVKAPFGLLAQGTH